jgi:hemerythrin superfamily protein
VTTAAAGQSGGVDNRTDVAALVAADHREVEALFDQLDAGTGDRGAIAQEVVRLLSRHAVAEEQVLYPALRAAEGGDQLADHAIQEHQVVKDALSRVQRGDPDDEGFGSSLTTVMEEVRLHANQEEAELLPLLREVVGEERMAELGRDYVAARDKAPTRPHPHAPNTPPGNVVAGAVAAPLDKVRDKLTGQED